MGGSRRNEARKVRLAALVAVAFVGIGLVVIGTPFILLMSTNIRSLDWTLLSNVGNAYGGIATVISTLALAGVVASIALQSREFTVTRQMIERTTHAELLMRAIDDPGLRECWGPSPHGDVTSDRQHIYSNLIVSFWRSMFEIGSISEAQLHALASDMFAGEAGRRYWSLVEPFQRSYYTSRRDRSFVDVLSFEHQRAHQFVDE